MNTTSAHTTFMARLPATITFVLAVALASPSLAAADDGVAVLSNGGVTDARLFDLDTSGEEIIVRDRGRRPLVSAAVGPVAIRDLKILPDDSNLLADVDGRGAVITDATGDISYALEAPLGRPRVTSASVTSYAAVGEPTRILVTDSNRSVAFVLDPADDTRVWQDSFSMPGARASFAQGIALPGRQAAIAVNWPSLQLSAIDLYAAQSGEPTELTRRLASAQHPSPPPDTVIVPELSELRDIMGLPNGNLLVTTRFGVLEVTTEGDIVWGIDISQSTELRGEFASARLLPSGRVAVATYEPGVWTRPHDHHRVHWLSLTALENSQVDIVATSEALSAAPARIEVASGHGGSGSFGYRPGLDATGSGDLSLLELARDLSLNRDFYRRGDTLWTSALLSNAGSERVAVARASIFATEGACGAETEVPVTLFEATAIELEPGEGYEMQGSRQIDEEFGLGVWCARVVVQNAEGDTARLGTPRSFEVVEASSDTGSSVVVRDLGYWSGDGTDSGPDVDVAEPTQDPEPGCACATSGRSVGASWLLVIAAGLGLALRRRRLFL